MNSPKQRLENHTNKVLDALKMLAGQSHQEPIDSESLLKIEAAITAQFTETIEALKTGRDAISFSLGGNS
jgi:hypothetical protein